MSWYRLVTAQRIAYGRADNITVDARPLVSAILPAYNAAEFLDRAIASVLEQSYAPIELIVVDDGSNDRTPAIITERAGHLSSVRQERGGVSAARNRGVELARGSLIAFIDADDEWERSKIERQVAALGAEPSAAVVINGIRRVGAGRNRVTVPRAGGDLLTTLLVDSMVVGPPSAMLVRREAVRSAGGFDPTIVQGEDWDLLIRLAMVGPFVLLPDPLTRYWIHSANASGDLGRAERDNWRVLEKAFVEPVIARNYGRLRRAALASHHLRFFLRYLAAGDAATALRCLASASVYRPAALVIAPWLVAHSLARRIAPGR